MDELLLTDPELASVIAEESGRQMEKLEMIASENFVSPAVREAQGSILTHKYAEGYPGKRYYGGCEYVDKAENLAIDRALKIFGGEYANVQPHSGSQANMAAYFAFLEPGDTILGMDLSHGGHLTHGSKVNFSGKLYNVHSYGVNPETELIDYDDVLAKAKACRPKMIVAGASAYPRTIDFARFRAIADEVGAMLLADMAHIAGLVAAGEHQNPVGHAHIVTSTTHKTLRGPRGGLIIADKELGKKLNSAIFPGLQGGPLMHVIAAKAAAFGEALKPEFRIYAKQVIKNARVLAAELQAAGFELVSGGTDNHLLLIDLTNRDLTGKEAETALDAAGITVNKNAVPRETRSPFVTSGVRLGTAALTTRGLDENDMKTVASFIVESLERRNDPAALADIRARVGEFAGKYPLFSWQRF